MGYSANRRRLVFILCLFYLNLYSQERPHPPMPGMALDDNPCAPQGPGLPPPVGLPCLPIDDYVIPMLLLGLILGTYIVRKRMNEERKENLKN